jgi:hypothetical protein
MNPLRKIFPSWFEEELSFPKDIARELTASAERSPDLGELEEYAFQLFFAPDRTMRGCSEYSLIEDSAFLCYAYTLRKYSYWQQRDGSPIPLLGNTKDVLVPPLKIRGELHAIEPSQFRNLDIFKDNLVSFRRERVKLLIPHRPIYKIPERYSNGKPIPLMPHQTHVGAERISRPVTAWMYVGVPEYWEDLLDGGYLFTKVPSFKDKRPWLGEFYSMKRETYF